MSESSAPEESATFRAAIDTFLHDRLQSKLDKLAPDDPKRAELIAEYQRAPWLESAAKRVKQIQARVEGIPGLFLAGNAYSGIGISDCVRTGRAAAQGALSVSQRKGVK